SSIAVQSEGDFWVEAGNTCGTVSDTVHVTLEACDYGIFAPSCFTPNDDLYNEGWVVQGYHVSDIEIIVYNRFGDAIFKANDFGIPWYPSTGVKQDVYNYRITATTYAGDPVLELGCIYLLR
ncbi:MAG: gliding motility-associated C-terminal domain-containing protein, partial [Flavobacteriales bacterium]